MVRQFRRLPAIGWPGARPSRGVVALGIGLILAVVLIPVVIAQSSRRLSPDLQGAARALNEGRYDDVQGLTAKLDQADPLVATLNGRAQIARGRYQEAEALLRPAAQRAPTSDAALELGLLLQTLGRPEAPALLSRVAAIATTATDPNELARAARALRAVGQPYQSNDVYRDAATAAPRDAAIQSAWGELWIETHKNGEALKSFRQALQIDPRYVPALIGSARALSDDNPPEAIAAAEKALTINPSSVDAHVFLANEAIDAGKKDEAAKRLKSALEVNPSSLEARALVAGLAYIEDRKADFDAEVARILAIAPKYGEVYRVAGEVAARNYRFDEAVALTRRGLALDPQNPRILASLGVHLLRTGDEPAARAALEPAFEKDKFDAITYNLLQMMDTLDKFVTVKDGDLIVRMDKSEAPVLKDYALSVAHRALNTLAKRYDFTPTGPILIEIFPKHDDFAVRNVGLPGMIGALGACFGRVVTMDSPHARMGEFQWEATLWHELAHVITLQMSKQRVPRWLTEGISVYEETLARREWGRGAEVEYAQRLNAGETLTLRDLNSGFMSGKTINLAYNQASYLVEYLVNTYGDEGLHKLLRAYGEGLETEPALKAALNTDFDELQTGFDKAMEQKFGAMRKALAPPEEGTALAKMSLEDLKAYAARFPDNFAVQMVLGRAAQKSGARDEAVTAFERAAALVPLANGPGSPYQVLAQLALENKDKALEITALRGLIASDFNDVNAARQLIDRLRETGVTDAAQLQPVYERITSIDPFDGDAHSALGKFAMAAGQFDVASQQFRTVIALGPVDLAAARTDLAESYLKAGKRAEARHEIVSALEVAPSYERAQDLLLDLSGDGR
jgi:tetratricopeptide (TPR) repeat protein